MIETALESANNSQRIKLFEAISSSADSEGAAQYRELLNLRVAFFVFKDNGRSLNKTLIKYYSDTRNQRVNSVRRWRHQRILVKDFYNVLLSARTYVEQNDQNHLNDPFHCFMKELRNFIVHRQVLPLVSKAKAENGQWNLYESIKEQVFQEYLSKQIQKDPNRKGIQNAQKFLQKLEGNIRLKELFVEYNKKITSLHARCIFDKVKVNMKLLKNFAEEVTVVHNRARELGMTTDHPITESQLRHLNYLMCKSAGLSKKK